MVSDKLTTPNCTKRSRPLPSSAKGIAENNLARLCLRLRSFRLNIYIYISIEVEHILVGDDFKMFFGEFRIDVVDPEQEARAHTKKPRNRASTLRAKP
jgi:hypothetical protein